MTTTGSVSRTTSTPTALVGVLRVVSVLAVLTIVGQGVTAGEIISRSRTAEMIHSLGAYGVHVLTGLTMILAFLVVRAMRARLLPAIVAAVVFVLTFVQAGIGDAGIMVVHVPLAMVLLVAVAWVAYWSFTGTRR
jgi:uncharacterized membrane protein